MIFNNFKKIETNFFEEIYNNYNKKEFIHTDPIQFPLKFKDKKDIEIAAIISSSLAYGRVDQIIKSLNYIFSIINSPIDYIKNSNKKKFLNDFKNFKYRFTKGKEIANLLINIKNVYENHKFIEDLFLKHIEKKESNIYPALIRFIKTFIKKPIPTLIPSPNKNSAFKRFNMFLRWVVRKDEIDIGIWKKISPSILIIPLDTHIHKISLKLKITQRKDTSIKTAIEITNFFKKINPSDPLKYDFALTRVPILKNFKYNLYLKEVGYEINKGNKNRKKSFDSICWRVSSKK